MTVTGAETINPRRVVLRLNENEIDVWEWLGFDFAGGEVRLGKNIDKINTPWTGSKAPPSESLLRIKLGSLLLTSVGNTSAEIGGRFDCSTSYVNKALINVRHSIETPAPARHGVFAAAVRQRVLTVDKYGPANLFQFTPTTLVKLGLLARVNTQFIEAAYGLKPGGLAADMSKVSRMSGLKMTAGCIAAAMITHRLGKFTAIPLDPSPEVPGKVKPFVPLEDWNNLVSSETEAVFLARFAAMKLLDFKYKRAGPLIA